MELHVHVGNFVTGRVFCTTCIVRTAAVAHGHSCNCHITDCIQLGCQLLQGYVTVVTAVMSGGRVWSVRMCVWSWGERRKKREGSNKRWSLRDSRRESSMSSREYVP